MISVSWCCWIIFNLIAVDQFSNKHLSPAKCLMHICWIAFVVCVTSISMAMAHNPLGAPSSAFTSQYLQELWLFAIVSGFIRLPVIKSTQPPLHVWAQFQILYLYLQSNSNGVSSRLPNKQSNSTKILYVVLHQTLNRMRSMRNSENAENTDVTKCKEICLVKYLVIVTAFRWPTSRFS